MKKLLKTVMTLASLMLMMAVTVSCAQDSDSGSAGDDKVYKTPEQIKKEKEVKEFFEGSNYWELKEGVTLTNYKKYNSIVEVKDDCLYNLYSENKSNYIDMEYIEDIKYYETDDKYDFYDLYINGTKENDLVDDFDFNYVKVLKMTNFTGLKDSCDGFDALYCWRDADVIYAAYVYCDKCCDLDEKKCLKTDGCKGYYHIFGLQYYQTSKPSVEKNGREWKLTQNVNNNANGKVTFINGTVTFVNNVNRTFTGSYRLLSDTKIEIEYNGMKEEFEYEYDFKKVRVYIRSKQSNLSPVLVGLFSVQENTVELK